ncbi:NAD-dependent epimerase/dehydratase family protein [Pseudoalteromonas sp. Z1A8]|uniref:NAD-dependent epimerase/dehydratase family protein n=1 Tax=Pseudoalteromonas sp. Z1A8 TaxID=2686354 RepID=UPI00140C5521|nr:NAD-dependent epimerase/dehydratase family protein [Pseudoalteromonas sp. Z1A8]
MLLITGYSGFVGSLLVQVLKNEYSLNLLGREDSQLGTFFKHDIDGVSNYSSALNMVNTVIHIAARVHVMNENSKKSLEQFRAVNTEGTLNLARQAAAAGVKRFIFVSSIKVNGESTSDEDPFTSANLAKPVDSYGLSKAEAELLLLELGAKTGMEIIIIRPPLIYGQGVKANFASLMGLVGKGLPLPFRSIKQNRRSLVSVYNLIDLIKVCIGHPNAANQIFLVSDDYDLSTAEMVALMAKVQGKKNLAFPIPVWCFKLVGKLLNKTEVIDRLTGSLQLDITHTKNTLNWIPPYSVEHGFTLAAKKPSIK